MTDFDRLFASGSGDGWHEYVLKRHAEKIRRLDDLEMVKLVSIISTNGWTAASSVLELMPTMDWRNHVDD